MKTLITIILYCTTAFVIHFHVTEVNNRLFSFVQVQVSHFEGYASIIDSKWFSLNESIENDGLWKEPVLTDSINYFFRFERELSNTMEKLGMKNFVDFYFIDSLGIAEGHHEHNFGKK